MENDRISEMLEWQWVIVFYLRTDYKQKLSIKVAEYLENRVGKVILGI